MRLLYAADLHGDKNQYDGLAELVITKNADFLIIGGDLFEYDRSDKKQLAFAEDYLIDYFSKMPIPAFIIGGNTDWPRPLKQLEVVSNLPYLTLSPVKIPNSVLRLVGYDKVNPTPFSIKVSERRDLKRDFHQHSGPIFNFDDDGHLHEQPVDYLNKLPSIEEELQNTEPIEQTIFVMHAPPFGTNLDVLKNNNHVGSIAIRKFIEERQPLLTLHGHIHESPYVSGAWTDRIGSTLCINPGRGKTIHAVVLDVDTVKRHVMMEHTIFGVDPSS